MKSLSFHIKPIMLLAALMLHLIGFSQSEVDSLRNHIDQAENDSNKVYSLLDLSRMYFNSDPDEAISIANEAIRLGKAIDFQKGVGYGLKNIGIAYYYQGDYVEALTIWEQSLEVFNRIEYKIGQANILSNIGAIYYNEADYDVALDYHLRSLKVSEEINDSLRILTALINIGAVYLDNPAKSDKALEYSFRALEMSEAIGDRDAIATSSVNIGEIYFMLDKDSLALYYFEKSLEVMEGTDGTIHTMVSISKIYRKEENYEKTLEILNQALNMADELNAQPNKAHAMVEIAETYRIQGNPQKAIGTYKKAANLLRTLHGAKNLEKAYLGLTNVYSGIQRFDSAYKFQQLYLHVKDSLYNIELDRMLQSQMFNFQIEKKQNEINLQKKDLELKEKEKENLKIVVFLIGLGFLSVIVFLLVVVKQKKQISREKERSEELLLNILPYEVAEELKEKGKSDAKHYQETSVLFTDFKQFTNLSEQLSPVELVEQINNYFKAFDQIIVKYQVEKIKTIGDAYMAAGGLPVPNPDSIKNVVLAAIEMQEWVKKNHEESDDPNAKLFNMRVGIHTGPVVAGIVGVKKFQYDIWGDTVNTASRMESHGEVGKVNISESAYNKIKDDPDFVFTPREKLHVKGKGEMQMYFVDRRSGASGE